jgi:hypothetical protein
MAVEGVSYNTALCLLTQVGNDSYKFATSKHFVSWLRLAPNNKISGGKVLSSRTPKGKNRLALALRQAAHSIGNQKKGTLSQFFKKIAFKKDRASAITATARKLATILFRMIVNKEEYRANTPPILSTKTKNKIMVNIKEKVKMLNLTEEQIKSLLINDSLSNT